MKCRWCDKSFEPKHHASRYCSDSCIWQSRESRKTSTRLRRDGGGRRPINPDGCKKITRKQLKKKAKELGYLLVRGDHKIMPLRAGLYGSMWWAKKTDEDKWVKLGMTNFIAFTSLEYLQGEGNGFQKND